MPLRRSRKRDSHSYARDGCWRTLVPIEGGAALRSQLLTAGTSLAPGMLVQLRMNRATRLGFK